MGAISTAERIRRRMLYYRVPEWIAVDMLTADSNTPPDESRGAGRTAAIAYSVSPPSGASADSMIAMAGVYVISL